MPAMCAPSRGMFRERYIGNNLGCVDPEIFTGGGGTDPEVLYIYFFCLILKSVIYRNWRSFPGTQGPRHQVCNSPHLVAWLRISGGAHLLPLHAFVTWAGRPLPSTFI